MKQNSHNRKYPKAGHEHGLSLIELMISVTIGLLILAALSSLFINQSRSRVELDKSNRMIDNGRYALELLSDNLRLAGFYDNYSPLGTPASLYDPCTTDNTDSGINLDVLNLPIQGYNALTASGSVASPPCSLTYTAGSNLALKPGSDILTVRRASTAVTAPASAGADTELLQVSMCQTDAATPPTNYQIISAASAVASSATMHKKDCTTLADLRQFMVTTYFVSPYNTVGDDIPTLKQINQEGTITPLVEGIEYMQIDYGVDSDGDGAADGNYTDCSACTVTDWSNVVSVSLNIVARNQEATTGWSDSKTYSLGIAGTVGPLGDTFKRHAYTQLVRLVNPAGRRETP